jgi:flavin-binding protein dodecin
MFEDYRADLLQELEDQDYDDLGTCPMNDIYKSMKLVGLYPDSWDEDIRDFLQFMAMRHSTSLNEIQYKEFLKIFEEDYNFLEDKKSIWENLDEKGELAANFEPSSEEGELDSDRSPPKTD